MNVFQAIHDTIREELQLVDQSPPLFFDEAIALLSKAHMYYRTYKQVKIYQKADQDPAQGHPAVYGAALQLLGDHTSIGSYAINVALITKCAQDILREYRELNEIYQKFHRTIDWQYPLYQPVTWNQRARPSNILLSPSFYLLGQVQAMGLYRQILKIARCTPEVFWQMFKLSMCLCDTQLLCNEDDHMRYEACTELVAEWDRYQNQLKEDQKYLVEEIENGSELANRILTRLGVKKDSAFIIDQLKERIGKIAEDSEDLLEDIFDAAEDTLETVYVKGKITPLHIDLAEDEAAIPPPLPRGRFPPWVGQKVIIIAKPAPATQPSPVEQLEDFIFSQLMDKYGGVAKTAKDIFNLAGRLRQLYCKQTEGPAPSSPFS